MKRRIVVPAIPLLLLLAACSQTPRPTAEKKEQKPPEPVSAQYAFHQMYLAARSWSPDSEPLRLNNVPIAELRAKDGKAGAWQATFVSDRLRRAKTFTYSVTESVGNLHKGVFAGPDESWSGSRGPVKEWPVQAFRVDATAAYQTAIKKGADYMKKHPDMPINFQLELTSRHPNPTWRVIWGESVGTSSYSILVDAATGDYVATLR